MSSSGLFGFRGCIDTLKTLFFIIFSFVVMYSTLLLFLPITLPLLIYRSIISLILLIFYKGKIKLVNSTSACFASDLYASVYTMSFFIYIKGSCEIELLRERIHRQFTTFKEKNGRKPYEIMLCSLKQKFGYFVWENDRDSFEITHHIRLLPGCSDSGRIYEEREVFESAGKLIDEMWDENAPRWEFLIVPQFKIANTSRIYSCIHLRMHHSYLDGISVAQMIRLVIGDQPAPDFILDPTKVGPKKSFFFTLLVYLQVFFLGPWTTLKSMTYKHDHELYEGPLKGNKFFGRTDTPILMTRIKEARKRFNCSTSTIQHYVFTSALRNMMEKKGFTIPEHVLATFVFAFFPYSDVHPQNNVTFGIENVPFGFFKNKANTIAEKLEAIDKVCTRLSKPLNQYGLVTSLIFLNIFGMLPATLTKKVFDSLQCFYLLSNVPGIREKISFNGNDIVKIFGVGPLVSKLRYSTGVSCYENNLTFGFVVEKSLLITNREDFDDLIWEVENEMSVLLNNVNDATV